MVTGGLGGSGLDGLRIGRKRRPAAVDCGFSGGGGGGAAGGVTVANRRTAAGAGPYCPGAKSSLVSPFTVTVRVVALPLCQAVALYAPSGTSLIE